MSQVFNHVYDRLKQLKDERRKLGLSDFADLGLESNTIYRCLKGFEATPLVEEAFQPRYTSEAGRRVIADFSFHITDEGREEFES